MYRLCHSWWGKRCKYGIGHTKIFVVQGSCYKNIWQYKLPSGKETQICYRPQIFYFMLQRFGRCKLPWSEFAFIDSLKVNIHNVGCMFMSFCMYDVKRLTICSCMPTRFYLSQVHILITHLSWINRGPKRMKLWKNIEFHREICYYGLIMSEKVVRSK